MSTTAGVYAADSNARYYMPEIGRFVSADTIVPEPENPQSYNRYVYVRNNPMNFMDPSGHREIGENENDLLPYEPPPPPPPPSNLCLNIHHLRICR